MKTTKQTKKTRNRTMRVDLRLTKSEKTMFFEKAGDAFDGNVTQMVVYAVRMLDENRLSQKLKLIGKFSESCNSILVEFKKSGTNLNQAAHQLNALMGEYDGKPQHAVVKDCLENHLLPSIKLHNDAVLQVEKGFTSALNELMGTP
ncbi:MAG: hypothetical protein J5548_01565 [Prevotella sp.]|nr:hypothetical protein [Prevotella sp.]